MTGPSRASPGQRNISRAGHHGPPERTMTYRPNETTRSRGARGGDAEERTAHVLCVSFANSATPRCLVVPAGCRALRAKSRTLQESCRGIMATCRRVAATCRRLTAPCHHLPAACRDLTATCRDRSATCCHLTATCRHLTATCRHLTATCRRLTAPCRRLTATCRRLAASPTFSPGSRGTDPVYMCETLAQGLPAPPLGSRALPAIRLRHST